MAARKNYGLAETVRGLPRTVSETTNPTMRALGDRALRFNLSQEDLAKRLSERFNLRINGANVHAHFTAKHPHRDTIERYRTVLAVSDDAWCVMEGGTLSGERLQHWEREVFGALAVFRADFEPGLTKAVRTALKERRVRGKVLSETALAFNTPIEPTWSMLPTPLDYFAKALLPVLDLRSFLRKRSNGDTALFTIYGAARDLYGSPDRALAFVDACDAIFRLDGFDTRPMRQMLSDILRGGDAYVARSKRTKGATK